jgi:septal ring factor EnvC (AmiA/AmiB activator)
VREFLKYNFKTITQITVVLLLIILLVRSFTSTPDRSELLKYKLDQLDNNIDSLKKIQLKISDSLSDYKKDIEKIDSNITNIRVEKTTINNYYEQKAKEIPGMTNKQIDSSFRLRYKY